MTPAARIRSPAAITLAALLLGVGTLCSCSSGSGGGSATNSSITTPAPPATATFSGAYSGTLAAAVCRDSVVDLLVTVGTRVSSGFLENAFPADSTSTRYRITLYNLGAAGVTFAQAPNDPKFVESAPANNAFFLDGIMLVSNGAPRRTIRLAGTLSCS